MKIYINLSKARTYIYALLIIVIVCSGVFEYKVLADKPITPIKCSDFKYQEDAQKYYYENRAFYLDKDQDGVACENLGHKPKGV